MEEEHQNQNNYNNNNMMVMDAAVQAAATTKVATTNTITAITKVATTNTITAIPVATIATATSTTEDGEGKQNTAAAAATAGGFIVHTKHTCDKCFKAPIIGKRYNLPTTKPNFDLCGDCASKYDGEDSIGLEETVLGTYGSLL